MGVTLPKLTQVQVKDKMLAVEQVRPAVVKQPLKTTLEELKERGANMHNFWADGVLQYHLLKYR